MTWKVAEAKNRFSELLNEASTNGPQRIRRRSEEFVVVRASEFDRLAGKEPDFIEFLLNGWCTGPDLSDLDLTRERGTMREIDL